MRIGMVLPTGFPPDIRVEKEVGTLRDEHDLFLLCPRRGQQAARENWQGMEIRRVFSRAERWWSQWNLMARCHSGTWETAIDEFAMSIDAGALHVHDLPLVGPALKVAAKQRIPLVIDLHENYPAMLEDGRKAPIYRLTSLGSLVSRLSVSVARWRAYEQSVVPQAQRVIVVVEEARERLVQLGVPRENIFVVGNYATFDAVENNSSNDEPEPRRSNRKMTVIYAGGFDDTRDLATVLHAVKALPDEVRDAIDVQLIGGQGRELARLRKLSETLAIGQHVTLTSWLPRPEAEKLMSEADVGLVPHVKSAHTDATIPHKLFQYMWRRLPVIVSDCAPLERIVREAGCGLVYPTGNSDALAGCLENICNQGDRAATLGEAGREAVATKYNWPNAGKSLLELYRSLE